jgi:ankyrin repeat protein
MSENIDEQDTSISNIDKKLHEAAENGNLKDVFTYLANKDFNNINSINKDNATPLILASLNGHERVVSYLISKKADLNIIDNKGRTAIMCASENGHQSIVDSLITAGANISSTEKDSSGAFIPKIVNATLDNAENISVEPRRQSRNEREFRDKLITLDSAIEAAISTGTDIDRQITKNIDINDDYEASIQSFISTNIDKEDKVLVVDFENIVHHTRNKNIYNKVNSAGIKLIPDPKNKDVLFPNVDKNEIDFYRIATFFILNYAVTNGFKCVVVICKQPSNFEYFNTDYKSIRDVGHIDFPKFDKFEQTFNCQEIQRAITTGQLKCITCDVKTACFTGQCTKNPCTHKLKGCDDSIIVIMYSLLKKYLSNETENLKLMSRDFKSFIEFSKDQEYYVPFDLEIKKLSQRNQTTVEPTVEPTINLVVNFVLRRFNLPPDVTDNSINRVIAKEKNFLNLVKLISEYYYNQSTLNKSKTGYDVKNWYLRNEDGLLKTDMNTTTPPTENFVSQPYVTIDSNGELKPTLNPSGKPYLDQSGNIAKLNNHPTIPYAEYDYYTKTYKAASLMEPYLDGSNNIQKLGLNVTPYCKYNNETKTWDPELDEHGEPYRSRWGNVIKTITVGQNIEEPYCKEVNGKWVANLRRTNIPYSQPDRTPATINVYEWQPYLNKYMKYKAKYNALKTKLGL